MRLSIQLRRSSGARALPNRCGVATVLDAPATACRTPGSGSCLDGSPRRMLPPARLSGQAPGGSRLRRLRGPSGPCWPPAALSAANHRAWSSPSPRTCPPPARPSWRQQPSGGCGIKPRCDPTPSWPQPSPDTTTHHGRACLRPYAQISQEPSTPGHLTPNPQQQASTSRPGEPSQAQPSRRSRWRPYNGLHNHARADRSANILICRRERND